MRLIWEIQDKRAKMLRIPLPVESGCETVEFV
jgi:hypothetical protein